MQFKFTPNGTPAPTPPKQSRAELIDQVNKLATDQDLELLVRLLANPKKKAKALKAAVQYLKI